MVQASIILPPEQAARTSEVKFVITPKSRPEETRTEKAGFHYMAGQG
jgi:hypothetical protein